jgi:transcriptional regulator with XRE-family HTH domain
MKYQAQLEALGLALRRAREAKGWSQRDLAARSGVTQANISKLETGQTDAQFSTLVELARFLDLELVLASRQAMPAIEAILRDTSAALAPAQVARDFDRIQKGAQAVRDGGEGLLADAPASLHETARRLADVARPMALAGSSYATPFAARELTRIANQIAAAQKLLTPTVETQIDFVRRNPKMIEQAERRIAEATRALVLLRNTVVHTSGEAQRPAYVLDEDEDA